MGEKYMEDQNKVNAFVDGIVEKYDLKDYIVGVAQIETETGGLGNVAMKMFTNTRALEFQDVVVALDRNNRTIKLVRINDEDNL